MYDENKCVEECVTQYALKIQLGAIQSGFVPSQYKLQKGLSKFNLVLNISCSVMVCCLCPQSHTQSNSYCAIVSQK